MKRSALTIILALLISSVYSQRTVISCDSDTLTTSFTANITQIDWLFPSGTNVLINQGDTFVVVNYTGASLGIDSIGVVYSNACFSDTVYQVIDITSCPESNCNNGIDDDGDGLVDCFDGDCCGTVECTDHFACGDTTGCFLPADTGFAIVEQWTGTGLSSLMYLPPVVADVDLDGNPEVFIMNNHNTSRIYAINGEDGTLDFDMLGFRHYSMPVIANIDGDPEGEIIGLTNSHALIAFDHTGAIMPGYPGPILSFRNTFYGTGLGVADFNQDGTPEVYYSNAVYDILGNPLVNAGSGNPEGLHTRFDAVSSVAADVLPDGFCADCEGLELVVGNTVYSVNIDAVTPRITIEVQLTSASDEGWAALADWDNDGDLDALVSGFTTDYGIYAWDLQTPTLMGFYQTSSQGQGKINIADFDGDGQLEASMAAEDLFITIDNDFSLLWSKVTVDHSGSTGSTTYDFYGDNSPEMVYRDEEKLYILDPADGTELEVFNNCFSGTAFEYPVVADVDNDDEAEILCGCSGSKSIAGFVKAFKPIIGKWSKARAVWNQYEYFVVNIEDDLDVPQQQQEHHLVSALNKYNSQIGQYAGASGVPLGIPGPDAVVNIDTMYALSGCGALHIQFTLSNQGDAPYTAGTPTAFYNGNPTTGSQSVLAVINTPIEIEADSSYTFVDTIGFPNTIFDLFAVANDFGHASGALNFSNFPVTTTSECDYTNNLDSATLNNFTLPVEICNNGIDDDCDGAIDYWDTDCAPSCMETDSATNTTFALTQDIFFSGHERGHGYVADIDNDGETEIITMYSSSSTQMSIRITNGQTGVSELNIPSVLIGSAFRRETDLTNAFCVADIDGDNFGEIIINHNDGLPRVYEHDGTVKWTSSDYITTGTNFSGHMQVADFNSDGTPEVYASHTIWNSTTGAMIAQGTGSRGNIAFSASMPYPTHHEIGTSVAADVLPSSACADCDGLELIAGHSVYSVNIGTGTMTEVRDFSTRGYSNGSVSIADWNNDGKLDIVQLSDQQGSGGQLVVWDVEADVVMASNSGIYGTTTTTRGYVSYIMGILDVERDGLLELALIHEDSVILYNNDLSMRWNRPGLVDAHNANPVVPFDLNADGNYELVVRSATSGGSSSVYILNSADGTTLSTTAGCGGNTGTEYPVIADVDHDGEVEILIACGSGAMRSYESASGSFAAGREIWNQYHYMATNINDDMSVPANQASHAGPDLINRYLVQVPGDISSDDRLYVGLDSSGNEVFGTVCPIVAVDDLANTNDTTDVNIFVLGNDTLPFGADTNTLAVTSGPNNGGITVNSDGSILYNPSGMGPYMDTFEYVICDTVVGGRCDTGMVVIAVAATQEVCDNGIDDDGDGLIDCWDPDCYGMGGCDTSLCDIVESHACLDNVNVLTVDAHAYPNGDYLFAGHATSGTNTQQFIFATRTDSAFNPIWAKQYNTSSTGPHDDLYGDGFIDANGDFILSGSRGRFSGNHVIIMKISGVDGTIINDRDLYGFHAGGNTSFINGLMPLTDSTIMLVGNNGNTTPLSNNAAVSVWTNGLGLVSGRAHEYVVRPGSNNYLGVTKLSDGNVLAVGYTYRSTSTSNTDRVGLIAKMDPSSPFNVLWNSRVQPYTSSGLQCHFRDVIELTDNRIIAVGNVRAATGEKHDLLIQEYDLAGNQVSSQIIGDSTLNEVPTRVIKARDGGLLIMGRQDTAGLIMKLDTNLQVEYTKRFDNTYVIYRMVEMTTGGYLVVADQPVSQNGFNFFITDNNLEANCGNNVALNVASLPTTGSFSPPNTRTSTSAAVTYSVSNISMGCENNGAGCPPTFVPSTQVDTSNATDSTGVTLNVVSGIGSLTYTILSGPDNGTAMLISPDSIFYVSNAGFNGNDTVTVIVEDELCQFDTINVLFHILPDCNPNIAISGQLCQDAPISFDASASTSNFGTIVDYAWDFGDGRTCNGPPTFPASCDNTSGTYLNPTHSYLNGGTYTVSLTVTDDTGCTYTRSSVIEVSAIAKTGLIKRP